MAEKTAPSAPWKRSNMPGEARERRVFDAASSAVSVPDALTAELAASNQLKSCQSGPIHAVNRPAEHCHQSAAERPASPKQIARTHGGSWVFCFHAAAGAAALQPDQRVLHDVLGYVPAARARHTASAC